MYNDVLKDPVAKTILSHSPPAPRKQYLSRSLDIAESKLTQVERGGIGIFFFLVSSTLLQLANAQAAGKDNAALTQQQEQERKQKQAQVGNLELSLLFVLIGICCRRKRPNRW